MLVAGHVTIARHRLHPPSALRVSATGACPVRSGSRGVPCRSRAMLSIDRIWSGVDRRGRAATQQALLQNNNLKGLSHQIEPGWKKRAKLREEPLRVFKIFHIPFNF